MDGSGQSEKSHEEQPKTRQGARLQLKSENGTTVAPGSVSLALAGEDVPVRHRNQFGLTQLHFAIQSTGKSSREASVLYGSTIAKACAHYEIDSHEHLPGCICTGSLRVVA